MDKLKMHSMDGVAANIDKIGALLMPLRLKFM